MKLPAFRPSSNAFMVFSMLLLGVFAAALVVVFDYWNPVENKSLSVVVLKKLKDSAIPFLWVTTVGGLTLMASGFFFYLVSFLLITAPTFYVRELLSRHRQPNDDIFSQVSELALTRFIPNDSAKLQSRKFRDGFMYLLLTSQDTNVAASARFAFTQVMYARSIGAILISFFGYVGWINSIDGSLAFSLLMATWIVVCVLYAAGLRFYEHVMVSGVLIEQLHRDRRRSATKPVKSEPSTATKSDA